MEVRPLKLLGHYLISLINQIIALHKLLMLRLVHITTMVIPWMSWQHLLLSVLRWQHTLVSVKLCLAWTRWVVLPLHGSGLAFVLWLSVVTSSRSRLLVVGWRLLLLLRWHSCEWGFAAIHIWNAYLLRRCCLQQRLKQLLGRDTGRQSALFSHFEDLFLLLPLFDEHVVTSVSLGACIARIHIFLNFFLMDISIFIHSLVLWVRCFFIMLVARFIFAIARVVITLIITELLSSLRVELLRLLGPCSRQNTSLGFWWDQGDPPFDWAFIRGSTRFEVLSFFLLRFLRINYSLFFHKVIVFFDWNDLSDLFNVEVILTWRLVTTLTRLSLIFTEDLFCLPQDFPQGFHDLVGIYLLAVLFQSSQFFFIEFHIHNILVLLTWL